MTKPNNTSPTKRSGGGKQPPKAVNTATAYVENGECDCNRCKERYAAGKLAGAASEKPARSEEFLLWLNDRQALCNENNDPPNDFRRGQDSVFEAVRNRYLETHSEAQNEKATMADVYFHKTGGLVNIHSEAQAAQGDEIVYDNDVVEKVAIHLFFLSPDYEEYSDGISCETAWKTKDSRIKENFKKQARSLLTSCGFRSETEAKQHVHFALRQNASDTDTPEIKETRMRVRAEGASELAERLTNNKFVNQQIQDNYDELASCLGEVPPLYFKETSEYEKDELRKFYIAVIKAALQAAQKGD